MQQQKLTPAYGMTKTEWATLVAEHEARKNYAPSGEGFFTMLKKRFAASAT